MTSALAAALAGGRPAGLYRVGTDLRPVAIERWARDHGWRAFHVDGSQSSDKAAFIRAVGVAMGFPAYSAANWDAFEESLRDLSWAPAAGYVLLIDHPGRLIATDPQAWAVARAILADAGAFWQDRGSPLFVLLRRAGRALPDVPWL